VASVTCDYIDAAFVMVVPSDDGSLTPETCRGFKTQYSYCKSGSVLSWLRLCDTIDALVIALGCFVRFLLFVLIKQNNNTLTWQNILREYNGKLKNAVLITVSA
jgi:hypothetical protein